MAFVELEKGGAEQIGEYPRFDEIGDYVEGNISSFYIDDYNNKRIELWKRVDGEDFYQCLPAHADLKRYYDNLKVGDYIRVELKEVRKAIKEGYNDKKIYKVMVDEDRFVPFEVAED